MEKRVCVIGAGPSGISAIKNIREKGIEVVAYDYNHDVGGNWIYSEKESHSSVFETTHIISSKTLSEYADFPFSPEVADYPSHEELRNYFQSYAKHFDLYSCIEFNTLVKSCRLVDNHKWEIVTVCDKREKKNYLRIWWCVTVTIGSPNTLNILKIYRRIFAFSSV